MALKGLKRNGLFILAGDRLVESLDERIRLELDTGVAVVKAVLLVGG